MSILGTAVRSKTLSTSSKVASACTSSPVPRQSRRREGVRVHISQHARVNDICGAARWSRAEKSKVVEDIFIRSLVHASSCRRCVPPLVHCTTAISRSSNSRLTRQSPRHSTSATSQRTFSTTRTTHQTAQAARTLQPSSENNVEEAPLGKYISRAQYAYIGNTYPTPSDLWELEQAEAAPPALLEKRQPIHVPLAPRLVITPEQEDRPPYRKRFVLPPENEQHAEQLRQFNKLLRKRPYPHPQYAWEAYTALPSPRPRYLGDAAISRLFKILSYVEFKSLAGSRRYFQLLDECIQNGVQPSVERWNTAIAFAGRWMKYTGKAEVRGAVETWMRMEDTFRSGGGAAGGGLMPDNVTFNILFDVAIRAGRFALADTIHNELLARNMPLNRYFRTSMIYYAGLRGSGTDVRTAFKDLVNAGEIVDTAVMNCVILSLIRSHEAASAENVFQKMKEMHVTKFGTAGPSNWRQRRILGSRLNRMAVELREEREVHTSTFFGSSSPFLTDERKEEAQRRAPIHPDNRTCQILIRYHCLRSGDLARVKELMYEIKEGGWNVHGSVYLDLFRGFELWGGHAYTDWTRAALEGVWAEFLEVVRAAPVLEDGEIVKGQKAVLGEETEAAKGFSNSRPDSGQMPPDSATPIYSVEAQSPTLEQLPTPPSDLAAEHQDDLANDVPTDGSLDNESLAPYFTPHLAKTVILAFYKCAGRPKMLAVWKEILSKWSEMDGTRGMTWEQRAGLERMVAGLGV